MMAEPPIRYAHSTDGVAIAYAVVGEGALLMALRPFMWPDVASSEVVASEFQWWLKLPEHRKVVIWDHRGTGLSGSAGTYSLEAGIEDMQAVVDDLGAESFDVLAMMGPCHVAVAYTARHGPSVRRLVLWNPTKPGTSMRSLLPSLPDIAAKHFRQYADLAGLHMFGWDRPELARRWADRIAEQYTGETWVQFNDGIAALDATQIASSVTPQALVIADLSFPLPQLVNPEQQQYMRRLAATIPNAQFSIVQKDNVGAHLPLIEAFLGADASAVSDVALPSRTAIILFADIVDSTALTERMGDAAFRAKARDLDTALRAIIAEAGGTTIDAKTLGDGVLVTFPAASQAIEAALACGAAGDAQSLPLHLGLHAGDVIREANNVFGGAVNIASRISALSAPGEVLVSRTVADLARTSAGGVTFEDRGEHALRGVGDPQRVFAVRAGSA